MLVFDTVELIPDTTRVVQRSEAYDPPEYRGWKPTAAVLQEWQQTLDASRSRFRVIDSLSAADHLDLYLGLLRFRLMDTYLKRWVKQGVISKAWLGTGEEAVTVGNCFALRKGRNGDVVGPMIRNAGAYREMGMSMAAVFKSYLGTADQLCKGRDLHIGDLEYGVLAPISMVAALVPVCAGVALAFRQRQEDRVALTWVGDGSARTGDFHEGMSMAAALGLPLVVVLQNNQVALGTRVEVHTRAALDKLHMAYGIKGYTCDGNNVLDTYAATRQAVTDCRKGRGPVLLTATTFRMGGHATHDEARSSQPGAGRIVRVLGRTRPTRTLRSLAGEQWSRSAPGRGGTPVAIDRHTGGSPSESAGAASGLCRSREGDRDRRRRSPRQSRQLYAEWRRCHLRSVRTALRSVTHQDCIRRVLVAVLCFLAINAFEAAVDCVHGQTGSATAAPANQSSNWRIEADAIIAVPSSDVFSDGWGTGLGLAGSLRRAFGSRLEIGVEGEFVQFSFTGLEGFGTLGGARRLYGATVPVHIRLWERRSHGREQFTVIGSAGWGWQQIDGTFDSTDDTDVSFPTDGDGWRVAGEVRFFKDPVS